MLMNRDATKKMTDNDSRSATHAAGASVPCPNSKKVPQLAGNSVFFSRPTRSEKSSLGPLKSRVSTGARTAAWLAAIVFAIGGCSTVPPAQPQSYALAGKASLRTAAGEQVFRFRWTQRDGVYDVWLWGALGLGRTHLQGSEDNLTLTASQQPVVSGPAAQIMQTHLGWSLPLAALGSWLNGQPAKALPTKAKDIDASGRLMRLEQAQFSVTFADHTPVASGWLPQRVAISCQGLMLEVTIRIPQAVMSETSLTPKDSIRTIARSKIVATNPRPSLKV